jgi:hypothetical protein
LTILQPEKAVAGSAKVATGSESEPHTPTEAPNVPVVCAGLAALLGDEYLLRRSRARVHRPHLTALPASWGCPGERGARSSRAGLPERHEIIEPYGW